MEEKFEIVCSECSNTFMSEDSNAEICPECWNKMVLDNLKEEGKNITVELHVAASDMGKVIGKQGRIAKAIRSVVKAASSKDNKRVDVEII